MTDLIRSLRYEFRELVEQTDYTIDDNLVRAAVRQYIKARVRVMERDADPARRAAHLERRNREQKKYRKEGTVGKIRGKDVVLKPNTARPKRAEKKKVEAKREPEKPKPRRKPTPLPAEPEFEVVWSGRDPLTRYRGNSGLKASELMTIEGEEL